jgi:hypothetical protein
MGERKARCPHDGGYCHHDCRDECWRFHNAGALSTPHPGFPVMGKRPVWQLSTDRARNSPRARLAVESSTRDPIFLFQTKRFIYFVNAPGFEWPDGWSVDDEGTLTDGEGNVLTGEDAVEHDCAEAIWETQSVHATREQARAHGNRRTYDWGEEGQGWRTYAVCAEGQLAALLVAHWEPEP